MTCVDRCTFKHTAIFSKHHDTIGTAIKISQDPVRDPIHLVGVFLQWRATCDLAQDELRTLLPRQGGTATSVGRFAVPELSTARGATARTTRFRPGIA